MRSSSVCEYARMTLAAAEALARDGLADFAVYLPTPTSGEPILYREAAAGLSQPDFDRLRAASVPFVYVSSADLRRCESVLENQLSDMLASSRIAPDEKARLVHQVGTSIARDLTSGRVSQKDIGRASQLVDQVIGSVLDDPHVAAHMLHMADHERTTASHMIVVSTLAVMLGAEVFGPEQQLLRALGLAGMMHDIGKLGIPAEILNKATPLTLDEIGLIQEHPVESVRLLGNCQGVTPPIRQMILQHHERPDGRGYPLGIRGDEVLPASRVLTVVDCFHAMIGRRSYRKPMTPSEAVRAMSTQAGRQFDSDILAQWNDLFERSWIQGTPQDSVAELELDEEPFPRHEHAALAARGKIHGPRPKRFECDGRVTVRCLYAGRLVDATCAPDEFVAKVRDVSGNGLCIYSSYPMYRGEVVHVQVLHQQSPVWVRGTVSWCRQHDDSSYRAGLRLVTRLTQREAHAPLSIDDDADTADDMELAEEYGVSTVTSGGDDTPASRGETGIDRDTALMRLHAISCVRPITDSGERSVVALSGSSDPEVRLKAVDLLAAIGRAPAQRRLVALAEDDNPEVRARVAEVATPSAVAS